MAETLRSEHEELPVASLQAASPTAGASTAAHASRLGNAAFSSSMARTPGHAVHSAARPPRPPEVREDAQTARLLAEAVAGRAVLARDGDPRSLPRAPTLARDSDFKPEATAAASGKAPKLRGPAAIDVEVGNAAAAPAGTQFSWSLPADKNPDVEGAGFGSTAGACAQLKAKTKKTGTTQLHAEVRALLPPPMVEEKATASATVEVPEPTVTFAELDIKPGTRKPDAARSESNVFVGDTVTARVKVEGVEEPDKAGIKGTLGNVGTAKSELTWTGDVCEWTWMQAECGDFDFDANLAIPGSDRDFSKTYGMTVWTDIAQWATSLNATQTRIEAAFDPAITQLQKSANGIKGALDSFAKSMQEAKAAQAEKDMWTNLLIDVAFAAAGAAGGGVAGVAVKKGIEEIYTAEVVKDLGKWAVKSVGQLAAFGAKVAPPPPYNASGDVSGDMVKQLTAAAFALQKQKNHVATTLAPVVEAARQAQVKDKDVIVNLEDPSTLFTATPPELVWAAGIPEFSEQKGLTVLWHRFLADHGKAHIKFKWSYPPALDRGGVGEPIPKGYEIPDWIVAGAKQCGEDPQEWANRYGSGSNDPLPKDPAKGDEGGAAPGGAPAGQGGAPAGQGGAPAGQGGAPAGQGGGPLPGPRVENL